MIQIAASTSHYGLGIAEKAGLFVVVVVKYVARPKGKWYERSSK
jgi:hypothetical protein